MIFPANEASIWFGDLPSRFDYPMIFPYISINHFYIMGYHWKYMMDYICGLFPYSSHDISYIIRNSINHIININYIYIKKYSHDISKIFPHLILPQIHQNPIKTTYFFMAKSYENPLKPIYIGSIGWIHSSTLSWLENHGKTIGKW